MWDTLTVVGVSVVCLLAVILTVFRGPGTWLVAVTGLMTAWLTGAQKVGWLIVGGLFAMAVIAEALELLTSVLTARKAGASRQAAWGGLIGGFAGMFVFSLPIPPPFGIFVGALLGCFTGSMIGEHLARQRLEQSARVGIMSAIGFALGTALKLAIVMGMAGLLVVTVVYLTWFADPAPVVVPVTA